MHSSSDLKQRLINTQEHITKEHWWSCWSTKKAVKCVGEGERHHSEYLRNWTGFLKAIFLHNWPFQCHQQAITENMLVQSLPYW